MISAQAAFFTARRQRPVVPGRASSLRMVHVSVSMGNVVLPALDIGAKRQFLEALWERVDAHWDEVVLLLGGWNFAGAADLRVQVGVEAQGPGDP